MFSLEKRIIITNTESIKHIQMFIGRFIKKKKLPFSTQYNIHCSEKERYFFYVCIYYIIYYMGINEVHL